MHSHEDLQSALARADSALFAAKGQGRDRVVSEPEAAFQRSTQAPPPGVLTEP